MKKLHEGLQKGGVKPATSQKKPDVTPTATAPKKQSWTRCSFDFERHCKVYKDKDFKGGLNDYKKVSNNNFLPLIHSWWSA